MTNKRDTRPAPAPKPDYSGMTAAEAGVMIRLDAIGTELEKIGQTLISDTEWKRRVTELLVAQGKALESVLFKRGGDDEDTARELRDMRRALLPPYTEEDSETTQPGAQ